MTQDIDDIMGRINNSIQDDVSPVSNEEEPIILLTERYIENANLIKENT